MEAETTATMAVMGATSGNTASGDNDAGKSRA